MTRITHNRIRYLEREVAGHVESLRIAAKSLQKFTLVRMSKCPNGSLREIPMEDTFRENEKLFFKTVKPPETAKE